MSNSRTRVTGMNSGLDTESLVQQLVEARRMKVTKVTKQQSKITFQQEAWKGLNSKLKSLFSKVDNLKYQSSYSKKTTSVSDPSVASIVTSDKAMNSTQTLEVVSLAKAAYVTGEEVKLTNSDDKATAGTLLKDLGIEAGSKVSITVGGKATDIEITDDMTLGSFTSKLASAGVNANFDAATQRIFIGAKDTGLKNDFALTADNAKGLDALSKLGILDDFTKETNSTYKAYKALAEIDADSEEYDNLVKESVNRKVDSLLKEYKNRQSANKLNNEKLEALVTKHGEEVKVTEFSSDMEDELSSLKETVKAVTDESVLTDEEKEVLKTQKERIELLEAQKLYAEGSKVVSDNDARMAEIEGIIDIVKDDEGTALSATDKGTLEAEAKDELDGRIAYANTMLGNSGEGYKFSSRVEAKEAQIVLNGATFTQSSNTFNINGLTITAQKETNGEEVTLNTISDTSAIYNMIKDVVKEYSSIINELDKLYNADNKVKYDPLSDEEKAAMSDYEVEKWEEKLKEQILARDPGVKSVSSALTQAMNSGFEVGGKMMYLFDFGIETAGYFSAGDNEKNALHIYGDEDDEMFKSQTNKLKEMIASDPDSVTDFFSQLSNSLFKSMSGLSSKVTGYRSYGSYYDDVKMKSDYDNYTTKIAEMEEKLAAYEDKWYAKFSKMETAMAKMQSGQNAISSMLGG